MKTAIAVLGMGRDMGPVNKSEQIGFSTLDHLTETYVDLERDLLEVTVLMCDLPEYKMEL